MGPELRREACRTRKNKRMEQSRRERQQEPKTWIQVWVAWAPLHGAWTPWTFSAPALSTAYLLFGSPLLIVLPWCLLFCEVGLLRRVVPSIVRTVDTRVRFIVMAKKETWKCNILCDQ